TASTANHNATSEAKQIVVQNGVCDKTNDTSGKEHAEQSDEPVKKKGTRGRPRKVPVEKVLEEAKPHKIKEEYVSEPASSSKETKLVEEPIESPENGQENAGEIQQSEECEPPAPRRPGRPRKGTKKVSTKRSKAIKGKIGRAHV